MLFGLHLNIIKKRNELHIRFFAMTTKIFLVFHSSVRNTAKHISNYRHRSGNKRNNNSTIQGGK